jgi:hypothetical protein
MGPTHQPFSCRPAHGSHQVAFTLPGVEGADDQGDGIGLALHSKGLLLQQPLLGAGVAQSESRDLPLDQRAEGQLWAVRAASSSRVWRGIPSSA